MERGENGGRYWKTWGEGKGRGEDGVKEGGLLRVRGLENMMLGSWV